MQKTKTGQAMMMVNNIHMRFIDALANGQTPDFALFEELKKFCDTEDKVIEIEYCVDCHAVLELQKSLYIRVFINQLNVCAGNGEEVNTRFSNREVYLCHKCSVNLVEFVKPSQKEEKKI